MGARGVVSGGNVVCKAITRPWSMKGNRFRRRRLPPIRRQSRRRRLPPSRRQRVLGAHSQQWGRRPVAEGEQQCQRLLLSHAPCPQCKSNRERLHHCPSWILSRHRGQHRHHSHNRGHLRRHRGQLHHQRCFLHHQRWRRFLHHQRWRLHHQTCFLHRRRRHRPREWHCQPHVPCPRHQRRHRGQWHHQ